MGYIKELRKYVQISTAIGLSVLEGMIQTATAQDFFNAAPGPKTTMFDFYANYSDSKLSGKIVPKLFTRYIDWFDFQFGMPFSISNQGIKNEGFHVGYITEKLYLDYLKGMIDLSRDKEGKYTVLNPQLLLTHSLGSFSTDAEGKMPINLKNGKKGGNASATIGYGNNVVRAGGSFIVEKGKKSRFQGVIRINLKKDKQYWLEAYISKRRAGIRFVASY